jgi:hypothetical protein
VLVLLLVASLLAACFGLEPAPTTRSENMPVPRPTAAPVRTRPQATGQKWTVMLYLDADDEILEQDMYTDLNEAEWVGSSARVQVVAQMRRFRGGFKGDANWTTCKRFCLTVLRVS